MNAWWRTNRWFLVALVVAIPAAVVVSMVPRWFPYLETQPAPVIVERGDTVRYSGADIQLTSLRVLDGVEWNAPAGSDVVVATLSVDVVEPGDTYCSVVVLSDEAGFERSWEPELYTDSDYETPDDVASQCLLGEAASYELEFTFLVPADQVDEPVLEITSSAALPQVLRLN